MNEYLIKTHRKLVYKIFSMFLAFAFTLTLVYPPQMAQAQVIQQVFTLPAPGLMVSPTSGYNPTIIHALTLDFDNPLRFTFIVDKGDDDLQGEEFKEEAKNLIKYFLASLTVPEDETWVNLSPYEQNRIIPEGLGQTEMGRDMLAQDYMLKQLTASLVYPEDELGKKFWDRVNKRAMEEFGTTDIPMNTFNKVWIMPESATIYIHEATVVVTQKKLKVMLEEDYLALQKNLENPTLGTSASAEGQAQIASGVSSEVVREIVIPELEREVNEGKTFAKLRQMYNSSILAVWYKNHLKESLLTQIYANQNKIQGVNVDDPKVKDKIYNQYVEAFKQGVFDYIKEDYDPTTQTVVAKKYFSGGLGFEGIEGATYVDGEPGKPGSGRLQEGSRVGTTGNAEAVRAALVAEGEGPAGDGEKLARGADEAQNAASKFREDEKGSASLLSAGAAALVSTILLTAIEAQAVIATPDGSLIIQDGDQLGNILQLAGDLEHGRDAVEHLGTVLHADLFKAGNTGASDVINEILRPGSDPDVLSIGERIEGASELVSPEVWADLVAQQSLLADTTMDPTADPEGMSVDPTTDPEGVTMNPEADPEGMSMADSAPSTVTPEVVDSEAAEALTNEATQAITETTTQAATETAAQIAEKATEARKAAQVAETAAKEAADNAKKVADNMRGRVESAEGRVNAATQDVSNEEQNVAKERAEAAERVEDSSPELKEAREAVEEKQAEYDKAAERMDSDEGEMMEEVADLEAKMEQAKTEAKNKIDAEQGELAEAEAAKDVDVASAREAMLERDNADTALENVEQSIRNDVQDGIDAAQTTYNTKYQESLDAQETLSNLREAEKTFQSQADAGVEGAQTALDGVQRQIEGADSAVGDTLNALNNANTELTRVRVEGQEILDTLANNPLVQEAQTVRDAAQERLMDASISATDELRDVEQARAEFTATRDEINADLEVDLARYQKDIDDAREAARETLDIALEKQEELAEAQRVVTNLVGDAVDSDPAVQAAQDALDAANAAKDLADANLAEVMETAERVTNAAQAAAEKAAEAAAEQARQALADQTSQAAADATDAVADAATQATDAAAQTVDGADAVTKAADAADAAKAAADAADAVEAAKAASDAAKAAADAEEAAKAAADAADTNTWFDLDFSQAPDFSSAIPLIFLALILYPIGKKLYKDGLRKTFNDAVEKVRSLILGVRMLFGAGSSSSDKKDSKKARGDGPSTFGDTKDDDKPLAGQRMSAKQVTDQINALNDKITAQQKIVDDLRAANLNYTGEFPNDAALEAAEEELDQLKNQLADRQKMLEVIILEDQIDALNDKIAAQRKIVNDLMGANLNNTGDFPSDNDKEIEAAEAKLAELEAQRDALQRQLDEAEVVVIPADEAARQALADAEAKRDAAYKEYWDAFRNKEERERGLIRAENNYSEDSAEYKDAKGRNDAAGERLDQATQALNDAEAVLAEAQAALDALSSGEEAATTAEQDDSSSAFRIGEDGLIVVNQDILQPLGDVRRILDNLEGLSQEEMDAIQFGIGQIAVGHGGDSLDRAKLEQAIDDRSDQRPYFVVTINRGNGAEVVDERYRSLEKAMIEGDQAGVIEALADLTNILSAMEQMSQDAAKTGQPELEDSKKEADQAQKGQVSEEKSAALKEAEDAFDLAQKEVASAERAVTEARQEWRVARNALKAVGGTQEKMGTPERDAAEAAVKEAAEKRSKAEAELEKKKEAAKKVEEEYLAAVSAAVADSVDGTSTDTTEEDGDVEDEAAAAATTPAQSILTVEQAEAMVERARTAVKKAEAEEKELRDALGRVTLEGGNIIIARAALAEAQDNLEAAKQDLENAEAILEVARKAEAEAAEKAATTSEDSTQTQDKKDEKPAPSEDEKKDEAKKDSTDAPKIGETVRSALRAGLPLVALILAAKFILDRVSPDLSERASDGMQSVVNFFSGLGTSFSNGISGISTPSIETIGFVTAAGAAIGLFGLFIKWLFSPSQKSDSEQETTSDATDEEGKVGVTLVSPIGDQVGWDFAITGETLGEVLVNAQEEFALSVEDRLIDSDGKISDRFEVTVVDSNGVTTPISSLDMSVKDLRVLIALKAETAEGESDDSKKPDSEASEESSQPQMPQKQVTSQGVPFSQVLLASLRERVQELEDAKEAIERQLRALDPARVNRQADREVERVYRELSNDLLRINEELEDAQYDLEQFVNWLQSEAEYEAAMNEAKLQAEQAIENQRAAEEGRKAEEIEQSYFEETPEGQEITRLRLEVSRLENDLQVVNEFINEFINIDELMNLLITSLGISNEEAESISLQLMDSDISTEEELDAVIENLLESGELVLGNKDESSEEERNELEDQIFSLAMESIRKRENNTEELIEDRNRLLSERDELIEQIRQLESGAVIESQADASEQAVASQERSFFSLFTTQEIVFASIMSVGAILGFFLFTPPFSLVATGVLAAFAIIVPMYNAMQRSATPAREQRSTDGFEVGDTSDSQSEQRGPTTMESVESTAKNFLTAGLTSEIVRDIANQYREGKRDGWDGGRLEKSLSDELGKAGFPYDISPDSEQSELNKAAKFLDSVADQIDELDPVDKMITDLGELDFTNSEQLDEAIKLAQEIIQLSQEAQNAQRGAEFQGTLEALLDIKASSSEAVQAAEAQVEAAQDKVKAAQAELEENRQARGTEAEVEAVKVEQAAAEKVAGEAIIAWDAAANAASQARKALGQVNGEVQAAERALSAVAKYLLEAGITSKVLRDTAEMFRDKTVFVQKGGNLEQAIYDVLKDAKPNPLASNRFETSQDKLDESAKFLEAAAALIETLENAIAEEVRLREELKVAEAKAEELRAAFDAASKKEKELADTKEKLEGNEGELNAAVEANEQAVERAQAELDRIKAEEVARVKASLGITEGAEASSSANQAKTWRERAGEMLGGFRKDQAGAVDLFRDPLLLALQGVAYIFSRVYRLVASMSVERISTQELEGLQSFAREIQPQMREGATPIDELVKLLPFVYQAPEEFWRLLKQIAPGANLDTAEDRQGYVDGYFDRESEGQSMNQLLVDFFGAVSPAEINTVENIRVDLLYIINAYQAFRFGMLAPEALISEMGVPNSSGLLLVPNRRLLLDPRLDYAVLYDTQTNEYVTANQFRTPGSLVSVNRFALDLRMRTDVDSGAAAETQPAPAAVAPTTAASDEVGGIDFNPATMNLKIMRDESGIPLPFFKQPVSVMNIQGFYPVILNVAPINVPMLLGMADEPNERSAAGGELDAFDRLSAVKLDDV